MSREPSESVATPAHTARAALRLRTVQVAGIPVYAGRRHDAVRALVALAQHREHSRPLCVSATSAHGIVEVQRDPSFADVLRRFALNLPDGMPLVWVGRSKGAPEMERCYGPGVFEEVLRATAPLSIGHFFCGGKPGVPERLAEAVRERFGNENVVGTFSPPFRPMTPEELDELAELIDRSGAAIVWIGVSTPKQERLALELSRRLRGPRLIVTVGAAFDFHIGAVRRAPVVLQRLGLEWAFRLAMEPRRLWRRYAVVVPGFIWCNLAEFAAGPRSWRQETQFGTVSFETEDM